jgi:hypothetical protein
MSQRLLWPYARRTPPALPISSSRPSSKTGGFRRCLGGILSAIGPVDALYLAQQLCGDGLLLYSNAHRFWNDSGVMQDIWELRDSFKATGRMLVLLVAPGSTLPQELG